MSNAIKHCQDDTDQPIFEYYEKWIFEAKEKLNRKLGSEVPRLKIYKGKKRAHTDHIWPLFHIMDDQQINVTLVADTYGLYMNEKIKLQRATVTTNTIVPIGNNNKSLR